MEDRDQGEPGLLFFEVEVLDQPILKTGCLPMLAN